MSSASRPSSTAPALQDWNTNDMCFDVPTLIEFLSGSKTLVPGTVILTGTPHGVGMARKPPIFLKPGDTVSIVIDKIRHADQPGREREGLINRFSICPRIEGINTNRCEVERCQARNPFAVDSRGSGPPLQASKPP